MLMKECKIMAEGPREIVCTFHNRPAEVCAKIDTANLIAERDAALLQNQELTKQLTAADHLLKTCSRLEDDLDRANRLLSEAEKVLDIVRRWNDAHTSIEGELWSIPLRDAIEAFDKMTPAQKQKSEPCGEYASPACGFEAKGLQCQEPKGHAGNHRHVWPNGVTESVWKPEEKRSSPGQKDLSSSTGCICGATSQDRTHRAGCPLLPKAHPLSCGQCGSVLADLGHGSHVCFKCFGVRPL
jgi:hypothetical protein